MPSWGQDAVAVLTFQAERVCQFLPRELTFSAVEDKVESGRGEPAKQKAPSFPPLVPAHPGS